MDADFWDRLRRQMETKESEIRSLQFGLLFFFLFFDLDAQRLKEF